MCLLAVFAFVPVLAAAQPFEMPPERAKEFAGMLGGASIQAAQAAATCENVRAGSGTGSAVVPKEAQGLFPEWRGGLDVRWLREQSANFEKGFSIVVNRLALEDRENAQKLRGDFERAMAGDTASAGPKPDPAEAAEKEKMLADPKHAAVYCAGLRSMVEMMSVLLTAVPRDGTTPGR